MNKYADNLPVNARITVDYTKPNNPVKFEYPLKHQNIKKWILKFIFPSIILVWCYVLFVVLLGIAGYEILTSLDSLGKIPNTPEISVVLSELLKGLIIASSALLGILLPSLLISFYIGYNYEKFKYWFPKFQAFMAHSNRNFHTFLVDELKEPLFEIPLFRNVMLTYEVSGDFSKYLQRVEIREHDFQYKGEKTQWLWKAKFIFSEIPKKGMLVGKFN